MSLAAYMARSRFPDVPPMRSAHVSAPIGGVNTIASGTDMPLSDLIYCYNMIGAEYGLRSRLGWREWCTGLGSPPEQVRSLLPFAGATADKLFACTTSGIWDVTSSSQAPTRVVTFATQSTDSGWGTSTVFVNAGGAHFLIYCDEANGYFSYAESGAVWTEGGIAGTPITGANPARLASVVPWKNRLWFVEKDSAKAWYLGIGAVSGAATEFNFGARFKAGGPLRNLFSWTFDGGSGVDDALVAISGAGDVVIYKGTDPSSAATFGIQGVWFVGSVPAGRRLATDFGGDLLLMSSQGMLLLSILVGGLVNADRSQYQTLKIANLWNQLQASTSTLRGWAMVLHPQDAALLVLVPRAVGQPTQQLAMSLFTKGWHQYRDMPMGVCAVPWGGSLYFGTEDGRVCINDGYVDGLLLSDPNAFSTINWSILTAFSNFGSPTQKQVQIIRPTLLSQGGAINHQATARYRWNFSEPAVPTGSAAALSSVWDTALWDSAVWGGAYQTQQQVFGASGIGPEVAIALRGAASSRMTLTGLDVGYTEGGFL